MLPFGRKNARKCSECDITCHANCAHLVPDFCGMSMETASELIRNLRDINTRRKDRQQIPRPYQETISTSPPNLADRMGQMQLNQPPLPLPPTTDSDPFARQEYRGDERHYPQHGSQSPPPQQPPYGPSQPPAGRPPGPARVPVPQAPPHESQAPPRPPPGAFDPLASGYAQPPYQVCPFTLASS